jgi:hypothetical protein
MYIVLKTYGRLEVELYAFNSALNAGVVSFTPRAL